MNSRLPKILFSISCAAISVTVGAQTTTYTAHYLESSRGPQTYKDLATGTIFYVENDGRHVAAIGVDGKLIWVRDPFSEGKLEFYRTKNPVIVSIGKPTQMMIDTHPGPHVAITFNSSQFGIINAATGEFTFLGQD